MSGATPRIPAFYTAAIVRCVTPVDEALQAIGIAFNLVDGTVVRIFINTDDAKELARLITSGATIVRETGVAELQP